jgi:hypothetical protein
MRSKNPSAATANEKKQAKTSKQRLPQARCPYFRSLLFRPPLTGRGQVESYFANRQGVKQASRQK